jgi:hypothetical protein
MLLIHTFLTKHPSAAITPYFVFNGYHVFAFFAKPESFIKHLFQTIHDALPLWIPLYTLDFIVIKYYLNSILALDYKKVSIQIYDAQIHI